MGAAVERKGARLKGGRYETNLCPRQNRGKITGTSTIAERVLACGAAVLRCIDGSYGRGETRRRGIRRAMAVIESPGREVRFMRAARRRL